MKKTFLAILVLASLTFFVACSKSNSTPPAATPNPNPIVGLWVGSYQFDNPAPGYTGQFYYSFNIFSDSTIIMQGSGVNGLIFGGQGTWTIAQGTAFTATTVTMDAPQSWTQKLTAKYDSTAGTLTQGHEVFISGGTATGNFTMKRVQ